MPHVVRMTPFQNPDAVIRHPASGGPHGVPRSLARRESHLHSLFVGDIEQYNGQFVELWSHVVDSWLIFNGGEVAEIVR